MKKKEKEKNTGLCIWSLSVCEGFSSQKSIPSTSFDKLQQPEFSCVGAEDYVVHESAKKNQSVNR